MKPYRPRPDRIPELDGLRVLLVFIVSWFHIWQQSWLGPHIGSYSLDFLVRAGYVMVDGTILLSGFLLFLPHARSMILGDPVPDVRRFYQRRIMRIVPSYYFITLVMLFAVAIPYDLYGGNTERLLRDTVAHLTFTQTFDYVTYVATPIGVASWTLVIEMQAYLVFPLIARFARKRPYAVFVTMVALSLGFRLWCLQTLTAYDMVVNQLINFLDVYAIGIIAAIAYVKLTTLYPRDRSRFLWQVIATCMAALAVWGLEMTLRAQAGCSGSVAIQAGQMLRRPLFAALLAILTVSLPFALRPIRFLMGNRLMGFLAMISMNYYLIHQNLAVHLKRLGLPPSLSATPHFDGEYPWKVEYTYLCFGLALLLALLVTLAIEKPGAWLLGKLFGKVNAWVDVRKEPAPNAGDEPCPAADAPEDVPCPEVSTPEDEAPAPQPPP